MIKKDCLTLRSMMSLPELMERWNATISPAKIILTTWKNCPVTYARTCTRMLHYSTTLASAKDHNEVKVLSHALRRKHGKCQKLLSSPRIVSHDAKLSTKAFPALRQPNQSTTETGRMEPSTAFEMTTNGFPRCHGPERQQAFYDATFE